MVMFLQTILSLSMLALLQLGATQQFVVLTRNQLREEIRAGITAALASTGNQSPTPLNILRNDSCTCNNATLLQEVVDRLSTLQLGQQQMNMSVMSSIQQLQLDQQQMNDTILQEVQSLRHPGRSTCYPASSCREIKADDPSSPSGYYYIRPGSRPLVRAYCDMSRSCGGITGGWMRVTKIDMRNTSDSCPHGLKTLTQPRRLCAMNIAGGGCSSASFSVQGVQYSRVCGKIIGYQQKSPDAFGSYYNNRRLTIDDIYVDGISLTHGRNPRKHIWTFAAALHEVITSYRQFICPCTNTHNPLTIPIPPYVGSDYFCDTASESYFQYRFYPYDPLWDGQGCGRLNTCCSFNNPPWFMKELSSSTSDNIEMRLCADQERSDEDINFESVEIYVQ